jgi:hypothetical protein
MSTSNQNQPESSDEQRFIQRAMADIDKAEKVQKIKQIVVIGILFGALVWVMIREPGPGITTPMVLLAVVILIAKILFKIDSSTRTILRAIGNRR